MACMVSTLDLRKAEEIGAMVAVSGAYWVKSPNGGRAKLPDRETFARLDRAAITPIIAASHADNLIHEAMIAAADRCGVNDDELEEATGVALGIETDVFTPELVKKGFSDRIQKIATAFQTIRSRLLHSQEFQQGYHHAPAAKAAEVD